MFSHLCQSVYGIQTTHIHTGGDQWSSRLFPPSTSWTAKALPDWCCVDTCPANNCSHCMFTYVNVGHTFQTNHGRTNYLNAELVSFFLNCSCSTSIVLLFRVIWMHLRLNALEVYRWYQMIHAYFVRSSCLSAAIGFIASDTVQLSLFGHDHVLQANISGV